MENLRASIPAKVLIEGDEDRHDADDRRPEALQEEEDDEDDEDDRLEEGLLHLVDGDLHEVVRVEGDHVVDSRGEACLHLPERLSDRVRDVEAVGAGLLVDDDQGRRRRR